MPQASSEVLGQRRALPDWGYDHGFSFDSIDETHPLWMETAVEEFVHALLYPSADEWQRSDRAIRQVMRARAGPAPRAGSSVRCGAGSAQQTFAAAPTCSLVAAVMAGEPAAATSSTATPDEADSCDAERGSSNGAGPSGVPATARTSLCEYARRHKRALRTASTAPLHEQRFLVAEAGNWGLGNRLYSLVSRLQLLCDTTRWALP